MGVDDSMRDAWSAMQQKASIASGGQLPLFGGGGGGTSGGMDSATIDAKIAASEARTDTKFAKLDGKLDLILERVETVRAQSTDAHSEARTTRRTVVGTGISVAALLVALFALYTNGFNVGSKVSDVARVEAQQTVNQMIADQARREVAPERQQPSESPAPPKK